MSSATHCWPLLCFFNNGLLSDGREPMTKAFFRHFERVEVSKFPGWRKVFPVSHHITELNLYQAIQPVQRSEHKTPYAAFWTAANQIVQAVGPYLTSSLDVKYQFLLSGTVSKSDARALPASLARYALMYYVSSVVRYKPSLLDSQYFRESTWMLDSFTHESPIHMLARASEGIRQETRTFHG
jgi:hypothetical protein